MPHPWVVQAKGLSSSLILQLPCGEWEALEAIKLGLLSELLIKQVKRKQTSDDKSMEHIIDSSNRFIIPNYISHFFSSQDLRSLRALFAVHFFGALIHTAASLNHYVKHEATFNRLVPNSFFQILAYEKDNDFIRLSLIKIKPFIYTPLKSSD